MRTMDDHDVPGPDAGTIQRPGPGTGLPAKAVKAGTPSAMPGGTRGRQQHPAEHAYRIR